MTNEIEKLCADIYFELAEGENTSCPPHKKCIDFCPECWRKYLVAKLEKFQDEKDKRIAELEIHLGAVLDLESCMKQGDYIQLWRKPFLEAKKCMEGKDNE